LPATVHIRVQYNMFTYTVCLKPKVMHSYALDCELISDFLLKEFSDQPELQQTLQLLQFVESLLAIMRLSKSLLRPSLANCSIIYISLMDVCIIIQKVSDVVALHPGNRSLSYQSGTLYIVKDVGMRNEASPESVSHTYYTV